MLIPTMPFKLPQHAPAFFLIFLIIITTSGFAQGDLMVLPKRLVFDGSQRSQEINLINTGDKTANYAISIIQYKMTENGNFIEVTEPEEGQRFASDFLRYYPRQVILGPKEAQTVRVQLIKTGNLEQGEYRSHIYFRAVEEQSALGEENLSKTNGIGLSIKTVFGISIPVIIREGTSTTAIELSELKLDRNLEKPLLSLVINRTGNMSVYGDLSVEHISPEGLKTEIGKVKGLAIYTPNKQRIFTMQIKNIEDINLNSGQLKIMYKEDNGKILDETFIEL